MNNKGFDKARLLLMAVLILGALLNIVLMKNLRDPGEIVAEEAKADFKSRFSSDENESLEDIIVRLERKDADHE